MEFQIELTLTLVVIVGLMAGVVGSILWQELQHRFDKARWNVILQSVQSNAHVKNNVSKAHSDTESESDILDSSSDTSESAESDLVDDDTSLTNETAGNESNTNTSIKSNDTDKLGVSVLKRSHIIEASMEEPTLDDLATDTTHSELLTVNSALISDSLPSKPSNHLKLDGDTLLNKARLRRKRIRHD